MSVSTETQLNVRSITRRKTASSSSGAIVGVGEEQRDEGRHVGLDHADTLGDADDAGPRRTPPHANLGWVSVVMMARATASASVPGELGRHRREARRGPGPSGTGARSRRSRR